MKSPTIPPSDILSKVDILYRSIENGHGRLISIPFNVTAVTITAGK